MNEQEQQRPELSRPRRQGEADNETQPDPLLGETAEFGQAIAESIQRSLSGDSEAFDDASRQAPGQ